MPVDNYFIADQFSMLSKLMDIHGENSFKSKTYAIAAFNIEKLPVQLSALAPAEIFTLKGIGETTGKKILEIIETGRLAQLQDLLAKTPTGVVEMMVIKGLGPKKINTIWKEMEIESIGELLYACNENRLLLFKGFGAKTQKNVQDAIEFYQKSQGSHLYAALESYATAIDQKLKAAFPAFAFGITGNYKRQLEIISMLELVTTLSQPLLKKFMESIAFETIGEDEHTIRFRGSEGVLLQFHICEPAGFYEKLVETSSSPEFLEAFNGPSSTTARPLAQSEEEVFTLRQRVFVPAYLRETAAASRLASVPEPIQRADIKGLIHCHSDWSDGSHTIEELADACIASNLDYLVLSDHSKTAFYANGLNEERIAKQQQHIDALNLKLAPFKIFKSIECDILNDGALDYSPAVLATFDLVITSIHANLKMTEEKAMMRLIRAIENPYTVILGHMTGRLLLSRNGYPVDHKKIIDACAANHVAIELNAHPRRLDMDWRHISYALEKGVLISIDPDAHYITGFDDLRYGVLSAQKAGVSKEHNLSSFALPAFENYLREIKRLKGTAVSGY